MEGFLRVRQDGGGWRHYIEGRGGQQADLHCGCRLGVRLAHMKQGRFYDQDIHYEPAGWLYGRYEADLTGPEPVAYLYFTIWPGEEVRCRLPEGVRARAGSW